jgi:maltooligosyltrehalose synthase
LFAQGSYRPIHGIGAFSDNLVAFVRTYETEASVIVVPRLTAQIGLPPIGPAWDDTVIALPPDKGEWKDLFTGESYAGDSPLLLRDLFRTLPFAVLCSPTACAGGKGGARPALLNVPLPVHAPCTGR